MANRWWAAWGTLQAPSANHAARKTCTKSCFPRVGFSYRIDPKTVVRGGYDVSFLPANVSADSPGASPIHGANTSITNNSGVNPQTTVANPFPSGILLPSGRTAAALTTVLGQSIAGRIPFQSYGYVQQFNFVAERQLDSKSTLSVTWAGSKGTHLTLSQDYTRTGINRNQLPDQYDAIGGDPAAGTGLFQAVANPLYGQVPAGGQLGGATVLSGYLLRPYPQYQSVAQTVPRYALPRMRHCRRRIRGGQAMAA